MFSPNRICYHCSFFSEKSNIPITTKHCIFPCNISHYLTGLTLKTGLVSLHKTQLQSTFALVYVQSLGTRKITGCKVNKTKFSVQTHPSYQCLCNLTEIHTHIIYLFSNSCRYFSSLVSFIHFFSLTVF